MAIVPKSGSTAIARPGHPASTGEIVELPRVCAIFDKPYIARYARGVDGLYRLIETKKFQGRAAGKGSPTVKRIHLPLSEIDLDNAKGRCPWCGASGPLTHCYACKLDICSGQLHTRDGKDYFRCRASCGNSGQIEGVVDALEGWQGAAPVRRVGLPAWKIRKALPQARPRLLLNR